MVTLQHRIDRLYQRDRLLAIVFTVAMWMVLIFVFVAALQAVRSTDIAVALGVAMAALGALNTASALALIRRYRAAKDAVYRPDIEFLDRRRALEATRGEQA